jgi:RNA polymerase sigma factor (sigma-70 family)
MNVHFSYKIKKTADLENLIRQQTDKLIRLLQVFRPELVHLKGSIVESASHEGIVVALNLRLPSGQMAAQETGGTIASAMKAAFSELTSQLKKHKELLRNEHKWPRRRGPQRAAVNTVPFEQTVAAVKPESVSSGDLSRYVDANLPRLRRFVSRALAARVEEGRLSPDDLAIDDVISEAIANALDEHHDKPERMRLESWLYRLSLEAIDRAAGAGGDTGRNLRELVPVNQDGEAVEASVEPEGGLYIENAMVDSGQQTPEDIAARNELIALVERSLSDAGSSPREAFILYTIEGFTVEEIADISNQSVAQVRSDIRSARDHLQSALPLRDPLKDKLVEYAKTA